MLWNNHQELEGKHAFLGASQYHWTNWSDDLLVKRFFGQYSQEIGTAIHDLANNCIKSLTTINENDVHLVEMWLNMNHIPKGAYDAKAILMNLIPFVNDAIGFQMDSEVILFYSYDCFGTTDAIVFDEKHKILRIHDLKTGITPAHMEQLYIYAALFYLEYFPRYKVKPSQCTTILRLYQNCEITEQTTGENLDPAVIEKYMQLIENRGNMVKELRRSTIK